MSTIRVNGYLVEIGGAAAVPEVKRCGPSCPIRVDGRQVEYVEVGEQAVKGGVLAVFSDVWPAVRDDLKLPSSTKVRWFAPKSSGVKAIGGLVFKARDDLAGFSEDDLWLRAGQSLRGSIETLAHEAKHRAGGDERQSDAYAKGIVKYLFEEAAA